MLFKTIVLRSLFALAGIIGQQAQAAEKILLGPHIGECQMSQSPSVSADSAWPVLPIEWSRHWPVQIC